MEISVFTKVKDSLDYYLDFTDWLVNELSEGRHRFHNHTAKQMKAQFELERDDLDDEMYN